MGIRLPYSITQNEETGYYEVKIWKNEDTNADPLIHQTQDPHTGKVWETEPPATAWAEKYLEERFPPYIVYRESIEADGDVPDYYKNHVLKLQEEDPYEDNLSDS